MGSRSQAQHVSLGRYRKWDAACCKGEPEEYEGIIPFGIRWTDDLTRWYYCS